MQTFGRQSYLKEMPEEIIMEVFKMVDVRTFIVTLPYVCKEWGNIIHGERTKK